MRPEVPECFLRSGPRLEPRCGSLLRFPRPLAGGELFIKNLFPNVGLWLSILAQGASEEHSQNKCLAMPLLLIYCTPKLQRPLLSALFALGVQKQEFVEVSTRCA